MKNWFKLTFAIVLGAVLVSGCSDNDEYYVGVPYKAYGTVASNDIIGETTDFSIMLDNGTELVLLNNSFAAKNNDRVYIGFDLFGAVAESSKPAYYAKVYYLDKLLSKPPVKQSEIDEDPELDGQIGNDPVRVDNAVFSGKYLNVYFSFAGTQRPPQKHFINLVFDDVNVGDGKAVVTMRHNGYGDVPTEENSNGFGYHRGFVSFDISSLIPEGKNSVEVILRWTQYKKGTWLETEDKQDSGTFTLNSEKTDQGEYTKLENFFN